MAYPFEKLSERDFQTLGLRPGAEPEEIKRAYRELVKLWHPDRFQQQTPLERFRAEEKFKEISAAYRRICKEWKSQGQSSPKASPSSKRPSSQASTSNFKTKASSPKPRRAVLRRHREFFGFLLPWASFLKRLLPLLRSPLWTVRIGRKPYRISFAMMLMLFYLTATAITFLPWTTQYPSYQTSHLQNAQPPPLRPEEASVKPAPPGLPIEEERTEPTFPGRYPSSPPSPQAPSLEYFTLGSTREEVLRVQGYPNRQHGQIWGYGLSDVQFKGGRVWRYNNFDGNLKVRMHPLKAADEESPAFFTLGSSPNDVLLVQGTPTRVDNSKWYYGFSEIQFKQDRVENYNNYFGNLKVRLLPSQTSPDSKASRGHFTIGSTQDDVLVVQGTPTSIQGNFWFYQLSNILFRDGKVQHVVNSDGSLRFIPPDSDTTRR